MKIGESEFLEQIKVVDRDLADNEVEIPGRPIAATLALFKTFGVSGLLFHPFGKDLSFPVRPENISDHVHQWYKAAYGELLNVDPSPGRFPLWVSGAAYEVRLPLLVGEHSVLSSKHHFDDAGLINAVDHVQKLPVHLRSELLEKDENILQAMFLTSLGVTQELRANKTDLTNSAKADIFISCDLQCGFNRNPSLASWHSLQFAEKVLKQFMSSHSAKFSKIHDISKLRDEAAHCGYKPDPRVRWELFDFSPSVRYEPNAINAKQAIEINHEAWRIGYNVLKQIEI